MPPPPSSGGATASGPNVLSARRAAIACRAGVRRAVPQCAAAAVAVHHTQHKTRTRIRVCVLWREIHRHIRITVARRERVTRERERTRDSGHSETREKDLVLNLRVFCGACAVCGALSFLCRVVRPPCAAVGPRTGGAVVGPWCRVRYSAYGRVPWYTSKRNPLSSAFERFAALPRPRRPFITW